MIPPLVYCANGNKRLARIAVDAGWLYGAQLPGTVYTEEVAPLWFADQDWKTPRREEYVKAIAKHHPEQATVLDLEREEQITEVIDWAEEIAPYVDRVIIIPKVFGIIPEIPKRIEGADVILGYSVPTRYAGTEVPIWEFGHRPIHLLGGSPQKQLSLRRYLNVVSADGNYAMKMAMRYCQFWVPGTARYAKNRWWPTMREANDGELWPGEDAPYEAFRRSCKNIIDAWKPIKTQKPEEEA
ncbi:MAG: hypothetical protein GVY30_00105 [Chloroflexi bacterium]|nr:hypothetical protein [Chloroflexota bacterium]